MNVFSKNTTVLAVACGTLLAAGCGQPMNTVPVASPPPAAGSGAVTQTQAAQWGNWDTAGTHPSGASGSVTGIQAPTSPNASPTFDASAQKIPSGTQNVQTTYGSALPWSGRFHTEIALQTQGGWLVQVAGLVLQAARDGSVAFRFETQGQVGFEFQGNLVPVQATRQLSGNWVLAASSPQPLSIAGRNQVILLVGVPDGDFSRAEVSFRDCGAASDCSVELPILVRPGLTAF